MSHSDSEVKDLKNRLKKQLRLEFKAKGRLHRIHKHEYIKNKWVPLLYQVNLIRAVNTNDVEKVKFYLDYGVNPDICDEDHRSPLHIAASRGYQEIVRLLLDYGANPNKRDRILNTPMHLAACIHNLPIISMLIAAKADVSSLDLHGRSPLQLASGKLQILKKYWKEGAIEMLELRKELQQVVDLLCSLWTCQLNVKNKTTNVDDLQFLKLSLNTTPSQDLDDQMSKLLQDIEKLDLK